MTTTTRTIRLALATAAILALTSQAAQAWPINPKDDPALMKASYTWQSTTPASPAGHVAFWRAHDHLSGQQTSGRQTRVSGNGFGSTDAAIAAGAAVALVLVAGAGVGAYGRRRVPLSA